MKRTLFIIMFAAIPLSGYCQKLTKDGIDKFTKVHVKQTSYEKIWRDAMMGGLIEVSAKNSNGDISLWFKFHERQILSVNEGDIMYVLLDNDKSIKIPCINGDVANPGQNLWHCTIGYRLTPLQVEDIQSAGVIGLRIDQGNEYDTKEIKPKYKEVISKCLEMVRTEKQ